MMFSGGFFLNGGKITLPKQVFSREMLRPQSILRSLLHPKEGRPPQVRKMDRFVEIEWRNGCMIPVGEEYEDLFNTLKKRCGDGLSGNLSIRINCGETVLLPLKL